VQLNHQKLAPSSADACVNSKVVVNSSDIVV
jgi:hypothetical protein